ncbi:MAG: hypothetical protein ACQEXJ_08435 [Myxococcota bacterium]
MQDIYSDTRDEPGRTYEERVPLYAPAPLENTPWERPPREPEEDEDPPRVVIIDL